MRKTFLSVAAFAVAISMIHGAFACELNREVSRQSSVIVADCGGLGCVPDPAQDAFAFLVEHTQLDLTQDCGAAYFDLDTYTGTNGLMVWLMATLGAESEYRLGGGFAPSPMDANAQYR
jgi:hypothetical protein